MCVLSRSGVYDSIATYTARHALVGPHNLGCGFRVIFFFLLKIFELKEILFFKSQIAYVNLDFGSS